VKVTESLDTVYGLDAEAVKAVKQWLFTPGTKNGKPVPVKVDIEMTFTLKD
jgi:TonB family protein